MLKLHRLELSGFKSFVDPSILEFAGGVTAIVGPNGCGKSNVSDAVTWALGEQSAKTLRGETMEDVIFNGSEQRKPLGMGEVTLTLLTDPGFAGAQDGRLVLSRRVFRSGESQYRLNGRVVRLKDFRDLLMDTGLGIRAYSVIEQGKIGLILSGKPQERRRLIEEAAGITRYKARKRVAEVKLEEAAANLLRLDDIVAEIERNLRSLKRQAGAARRYQEKKEEYATLLRAALLGRWSEVHGRLATLTADLAREVAADAELAAALHRDEAAWASGREALERHAEELSGRHRRQAELAAAIEGRQELIKGARQTLQEIAERAAAGDEQARRRRLQMDEQARGGADLAARRQTLAAAHGAAAAEVAEDERRIAAADASVAAAEARLEELRARLLASLAATTALRNRVHREQIEAEKGSYQHQHLGEQLTLWSTQLEEAAARLDTAAGRLAELEASLAARETRLANVERQLVALEARLAAAGERRRTLEAELAAARQRRQFLSELGEAHAERREALRRALAAAGLAEPAFLGDRVAAPSGWERSLDLYLGELADAVLVPAGGDALVLAGELAASGAAGSLLALTGTPPAAALLSDPAIVAPLAAALGLPPEIGAALPPAYLVADAPAAAALARRHPGAAFVARERIWAQAGVLHVQGEQVQPGLLARGAEAAELDARLPALEGELDAARVEAADAESRRGDQLSLLEQARAEAAAAREELAVVRARQEDAAARHRRLTVEHQTLATERQEVERELERLTRRRQDLAAELVAAEAAHAALQSELDAAQGEAERERAERESLRTLGAGRRGRLELLGERLAAHNQEAARVETALNDGERQEAAWREEAAAIAARQAELEAAMARAGEELQEALERRAAGQDATVDDQRRLDDRRAELRRLEERVTARRAEREAGRARIEERRVAQAALRQDAEHLAAAFHEEFHEDLPADPPAADPAAASLAELEADLAQCKAALERLGPVNVLAAEEHAEQEQRYDFLTVQRADVATSVESLRKTIREINQTSGERFAKTFAEVNKSFGEVFTELFRGGEAEMRLLDEEDLLESGIEIVARPPGKRLQNLMLLSGGEKALTAIALLFALFKTKPSPFCILDEVDAPLDDVNTLRFVHLLREMSKETQFIVITHNKLTMEVAGTLYGVTMEERGVSKLVAVAMAELQPEATAASA